MAHRIGLMKLEQVFSYSIARKRGLLNGIPCNIRFINEVLPKLHQQKVTVTFITNDGGHTTVQATEREDLLSIIRNDTALDLKVEGFGACGGTCSCSTCHVILSKEHFDRIPPIDPEGGENDMLGIIPDLTETSRLGCQVNVTKELDGMIVHLPMQSPQDARNDLAKI